MAPVMTEATYARVLLADDTPDIRALLRLVLSRQEDFGVVAEAADGREAVAMAQEHRPDLVLLDLAMPVMDGLEAIPGVRAAAPDCKIVVLSGFNAEQMAEEALAAGADAYLEKGTPPMRLVSELRRICGLREVAPPTPPPPPPAPSEPAADITVTPSPAAAGREGAWGEAELAVVHHELMSPLAIIDGFSSLLARKPGLFSPEQIQEHATSIGRSARHLRALIEEITDARRIELAALDVRREQVDVAALVREVVQDMATVGRDHVIAVQAPDALAAQADPVRVRQVLTNLLSNAVKFSPLGSHIEVSVAVGASLVEVAVRDEGPGIPRDQHHAVFQRFTRLQPGVKGMGLGLFIAQAIAHAHGGEVLIADHDPPGATFILRLPHP